MVRVVWTLGLLLLCLGCEKKGLTSEQLTTVVNEQKASLDACYDTALRAEPRKEGLQAEAMLRIAPSGEVDEVEIEGDLPLPGLKSCVEDAISKWPFPSAEGPTRRRLPLIFEPRVVQDIPLGGGAR